MFKPKMPKAAAAAPLGGPLPKVRSARHTTPRPRFHRAKMSGLGKSAYSPPHAKQAFDDPMAAGQPDMAFGGGGPDMAGGGAPEPGVNDAGAAGPPVG